jgi:hypothetical protein
VSGQTIPRDADLRMGGGRFEGASVKVNESSNRFYRRGAENAEGMAPAERGPTGVRSFWGRIDEGGAGDRVEI